MRLIYEASNSVEAHMVLNMLQQYGLKGRVDGEFLQGGVGELQAIGLVKVLIVDEDFDRARQILSEWEEEQPKTILSKEKASFANEFVWFFVGLVVGIFAMLIFCRYSVYI